MSDKKHIDPDLIPGADLKPDDIEIAANQIGLIGADVATNGGTVLTSWQGITAHYQAPEAQTLFSVMDPVKTIAEGVGSDIQLARTALVSFADEARPIKAELDRIRADAVSFVASIQGGVDVDVANPAYMGGNSYSFNQGAEATVTEHKAWHEDQATVDKNNHLLERVNAQMVLLWAAERKAANAIYDIIGYPHIEAATDDNPNGYGVEEIPDGAETPWGTPVEKSEDCGEQVVGAVKGFVWDGVIVGGIWGTVQGLGTLVLGYNPATGEFLDPNAYGAAWSNLGMLGVGLVSAGPLGAGMSMVPGPVGDFFRGGQEALVNAGKGIIAYDQWADDPAAAAGTAVFNVASILIPAGAAVAGVKLGAGTASAAIRTAATVMDVIDPASLAIRAGGSAIRIAAPAISDLLKSIDFSGLSKVEVDVNVPKLPGVDVPGGGIDVPSAAAEVPPVRDVPAQVPEPALVGAGNDAHAGSMDVGGARPEVGTGGAGGGSDLPGGSGGHGSDGTGSGGASADGPSPVDGPTSPGHGPTSPVEGPSGPAGGTVLDDAAPYGREPDGTPVSKSDYETQHGSDSFPSDARVTPEDVAALGGKPALEHLSDSLPEGYRLETSEVTDTFGRPTGDTQLRVLDDAGNPVPLERLADEGLLDDAGSLGDDLAPGADDLTGTTPDVQVWDDVARADLQTRLGDGIDLSDGLTPTDLNRIDHLQDLIDNPHLPSWLDKMFQGSQFNISRNPFYDANEVYITREVDGVKVNDVRLDSYVDDYVAVSRKYTQLGDVSPSTAMSYLREFVDKYPAGDTKSVISEVPSATANPALADIIGKPITVREMRLEVPPQTSAIPQNVLNFARELGITIRDTAGTVYK